MEYSSKITLVFLLKNNKPGQLRAAAAVIRRG